MIDEITFCKVHWLVRKILMFSVMDVITHIWKVKWLTGKLLKFSDLLKSYAKFNYQLGNLSIFMLIFVFFLFFFLYSYSTIVLSLASSDLKINSLYPQSNQQSCYLSLYDQRGNSGSCNQLFRKRTPSNIDHFIVFNFKNHTHLQLRI